MAKTKSVSSLIAKKKENPIFAQEFDKEGEISKIAVMLMELREHEGLSQAELAEKLGTSQSAIARLESGRSNTTLSTLIDVAYALGKKPDLHFI